MGKLEIDNIDLLKIDIEGYEYEALLGSRELFLHHKVKTLALELHPWILSKRGKPEKDILDMLSACGYKKAASPRRRPASPSFDRVRTSTRFGCRPTSSRIEAPPENGK